MFSGQVDQRSSYIGTVTVGMFGADQRQLFTSCTANFLKSSDSQVDLPVSEL